MKPSRLWILISIIVLACVVTLVLILVLPSSGSGGNQDGSSQAAAEESTGDGSQAEQEGHTGTAQGQSGSGGVTVNPGGGSEGNPGMVLTFPDPVDGGEAPGESPDGEERQDIVGAWVMDMTAAGYGLQNLHLKLEAGGSITVPQDYQQIFEITQSQYLWESGKPDFSANLQVVLKLGSNPTMVPVTIQLSGKVSDSLMEIEGSFSGTTQMEPYSQFSQQGTFKMRR